jgi:hypothetical protein
MSFDSIFDDEDLFFKNISIEENDYKRELKLIKN